MLLAQKSHLIIITNFYTLEVSIQQKLGINLEESVPSTMIVNYATLKEYKWTASSIKLIHPCTTSTINATKLPITHKITISNTSTQVVKIMQES